MWAAMEKRVRAIVANLKSWHNSDPRWMKLAKMRRRMICECHCKYPDVWIHKSDRYRAMNIWTNNKRELMSFYHFFLSIFSLHSDSNIWKRLGAREMTLKKTTTEWDSRWWYWIFWKERNQRVVMKKKIHKNESCT